MSTHSDTLELGRIRMSVGYGGHRRNRLVTPMQVGDYIRDAMESGESLADCAEKLHFQGTGHIGRFLRIGKLPRDIQDMISWGPSKDGSIGFSAAVELGLLKNSGDQRAVAQAILEDGLTTKEVREVGQLRARSAQPIRDCIREVLGMRPTIRKRYVFIGSISEKESLDFLKGITQDERDEILEAGTRKFSLLVNKGHLGQQIFTLVGDEKFADSMQNVGKKNIENLFRAYISEIANDARSSC